MVHGEICHVKGLLPLPSCSRFVSFCDWGAVCSQFQSTSSGVMDTLIMRGMRGCEQFSSSDRLRTGHLLWNVLEILFCDQASYTVLASIFSHRSLFRLCSSLMWVWAYTELEILQSQLCSDFSRLTHLAEGLVLIFPAHHHIICFLRLFRSYP